MFPALLQFVSLLRWARTSLHPARVGSTYFVWYINGSNPFPRSPFYRSKWWFVPYCFEPKHLPEVWCRDVLGFPRHPNLS